MTARDSLGQPKVFSIAAGLPFAEVLARGLLERTREDRLALSAMLILLPTRRACRALGEAFLRASDGRPLLLPRMVPLGDLDEEELLFTDESLLGEGLAGEAGAELPPAIGGLRRQMLLARLILQWSHSPARRDSAPIEDEEQALALAAELARLIDQVETEGLDFAGLEQLVPEALAAHWQSTLRFLEIVTAQWPEIQAEEGCIGPAERRRRLLEAQAALWQREPPGYPVIAAGSTGSIPATAELLARVARLPSGEVILPGLDSSADEATWEAILEDSGHPQHGLAQLLERIGVERGAVREWAEGLEPASLPQRGRLIELALCPAATSDGWRDLAARFTPEDVRRAFAEVRRLTCPTPREEASAVALLLREAVEAEGRTAALVTSDRTLARRVAGELGRWGIAIDDSAGLPLGETAVGNFLRLTARMLAEQLAPLSLLAALKHPLAAGGTAPGQFRAAVRALERSVLRGPRPAPGFEGLLRALSDLPEAVTAEGKAEQAALLSWLRTLAQAAEAVCSVFTAKRSDFAVLLRHHVAFVEMLAASDREGGAEGLWSGEDGEAAARFLAELDETAGVLGKVAGRHYPALLDRLMSGIAVRPRFGRHPRLFIWGPLEARLQKADLLVLGGLNEGSWPPEVDPGPWLNRPMRKAFGLPALERRIGLAAHDFVQAFQAREVVLTRAERVEGTPSVPSRWLLRLDAFLTALGQAHAIPDEGPQWLAWIAELDHPECLRTQSPPEPRPPVATRPRVLSVTEVETWMRDPYSLYAKRILGLSALDPLDADPGAADKGNLVHRALERFVERYPGELPERAEALLLEIGAEVFRAIESKPGVHAFWWPRFERVARWFLERERERRTGLNRIVVEQRGSLTFEAPGGRFTLKAKADRIEERAEGGLAIVDYKTGALPSQIELELGFAPQLPLEAAIAVAGGFKPLSGPVAELAFWKLSGGNPPGEIKAYGDSLEALAGAALQGLKDLVARFDDEATPYRALPRPGRAPRYSDYNHLARAKEWSAGTQGSEGA